MTRKLFIVIAMAGALSGCSTTWYNEHFSSDEARNRQLVIDEGYCNRVAAGAVPMPEIRTYTPSQQSYMITGNSTTFGRNGIQNNSFSGTVTPMNNGFASGFSSGMAQGAALGALIRAQQEHEKIVRGCMINLGWTDSPPAETKQSQEIARNSQSPNRNLPASSNTPQKKGPAIPVGSNEISCNQWSDDIARSVASAYEKGMPQKILQNVSYEYLQKNNASGREHLIFAYLINARYRIPLKDLSANDFPRYIRWECDKNWEGIGLSSKKPSTVESRLQRRY